MSPVLPPVSLDQLHGVEIRGRFGEQMIRRPPLLYSGGCERELTHENRWLSQYPIPCGRNSGNSRLSASQQLIISEGVGRWPQ
jgi:hypothetical protein